MNATATLPAIGLVVADAPGIAAAIAADIATRFGHGVDVTPLQARDTREGIAFGLAIEQNLGVMAMAISTASLSVRAAPVENGDVWVKVDLDWKHPGGGSNGYSIGRWWLRDGEIAAFAGD